jgi:poly(A) polymerase Pap1
MFVSEEIIFLVDGKKVFHQILKCILYYIQLFSQGGIVQDFLETIAVQRIGLLN